ncbi:MAG TPA: threonine/serine dehydratase [Steroidobacteraceae bacterium]|nr:threonine/serine dehydratase [Steroidobacteraceae bacterium]
MFLALEDFRAAYQHIRPHINLTPVLTSETLSKRVGANVFLKAELFQKAGSYKVRGPLNVLAHMSREEKARGIICSSAGNHAQGVARAARMHGIPATVVMSRAARSVKIEATRGYGAEVILHGDIWDDAYAHSQVIAAERGLTYIHPFDDPRLVAGQGSVGMEFIEQVPQLDAVLVPIGGGGLISGCAMAIKAINPKVRIIGVEAAGAPGMKRSVEAGRVVTLDSVGPMIDGLVVRRVGEYNLEVVRAYVDDIVLVPEDRIFAAVVFMLERLKIVAEGAAAAPVAALLEGLVSLPPGANVGCIVSGGNLDLTMLRDRSFN